MLLSLGFQGRGCRGKSTQAPLSSRLLPSPLAISGLGILGGIWSEEKNSGCGRSYFFTASWTVSSPRKKIIGGAKFSVLRVHKCRLDLLHLILRVEH